MASKGIGVDTRSGPRREGEHRRPVLPVLFGQADGLVRGRGTGGIEGGDDGERRDEHPREAVARTVQGIDDVLCYLNHVRKRAGLGTPAFAVGKFGVIRQRGARRAEADHIGHAHLGVAAVQGRSW